MKFDELVVIAGGGGFIGGELVRHLRQQGCRRIRAVDIKPLDEWFQRFPEVENVVGDLREITDCRLACRNASYIFNLAADMGGMGFIENQKADCMLSVLINTHMLIAAREAAVRRYFFLQPRVFTLPRSRYRHRLLHCAKKTHIRRCRKTDMVGRSCFQSGCAAIFARIMGSQHGLPAIIMSTVRSVPMSAAAKKRLPRSAEK